MSALSEASYASAKAFLRKCLAEAGVHGMVTLHDAFMSYDIDNSGALDYEEFAAALLAYKLTNAEIRALFVHFDADGNNQIDYAEFVDGVRGELSAERKAIIADVFDSIDSDCDGIISLTDIGANFLPNKHPEVVKGNRTAASILNDFMDTFHLVGNNGSLTKEDFMHYYSNTACFNTDEEFFNMMGSIWKLNKQELKAPPSGSLASLVKKTPPGKMKLKLQPRADDKEGDFTNVSFDEAKKYLQKHIASNGVRGMVALRDLFYSMDINDDGTLSYEEFAQVMEQYKLSNQEVRALYVGFDTDGSGSIDYEEFCHGVRGELNEARKRVVAEVFDGIDEDCDGIISLGDIGKCFVVKKHPDVLSGRKPAATILSEFLDTFAGAGENGFLKKEDFLNYYSNISAFMEDDDFFSLMQNIWKIDRAAKKGSLGALHSGKRQEAKKASIKVNQKPPPSRASPADPIVAALKRSLASKGAWGISGVSRKFKIIDTDNSKCLSKEEFKKGMRECGLDLTGKELNMLFQHFDRDGGGTIDYEEFIGGLRDPLSMRRRDIINKAFDVIDMDGNGIVEVEEVVRCYDPSQHPKVKSKQMKSNDALMEFLNTFEVGGTVDGKVTRQEFTNYYHNLSPSIDDDDYFELMIRNTWKLGGDTNTRVLTTMEDGSQKLVAIEDDLAAVKNNQADIIARLKKQGVTGVASVTTSGAVEEEEEDQHISSGKPLSLADLAAKKKARKQRSENRARAEEEKKEEAENSRAAMLENQKKGKPLKIPQSLAGMLEGKTVKDEMSVAKKSYDFPPPPPKQKNKRDKNRSALPSPGLSTIIMKLKTAMKKHGAHGFVGVQRKFRIMDDDGSKSLSLGEFKKAMKELKMGLADMELRLLFEHFDADHSGSIDFEEFIQGVRDPLTRRRQVLVDQAFDIIDKDGSGVVEPKEIADAYDAKKHPDVISGKKTETQVLKEFLSTFDVGGVIDGMVTRQEFTNYYTNIGANIDRDDYFELMIRNAWHMAGGEGAAASSANKRVLVTASNGKQSVVELKSDLGLDRIPEKEKSAWIINKLREQGVDVSGVELRGAVEDDEMGDELGPNYRPAINQHFSSAAPGVLPGTGQSVHSATYARYANKRKPVDANAAPVGIKEMIFQLKEVMKKRGASGIVGISRKFRSMDDDGNGTLDLGEFSKGMWEMDLNFTPADMKRLFEFFDMDGTGGLDYEEVVHALRDPLNDRRRALVLLAFSKIDEDGSGVVEPNELLEKYDASQHPDVMGGLKTEEEVLKEFVAVFEVGGVVDGMVTQEEFLNYYENLGVNIDNDDYFELMIRNAWHISGGTGWCENSSNMRVKCMMPDGSQKIVELKDDLGVGKDDYYTIKKRLKQQGVYAVNIDTKGTVEEDKNDSGLGLEEGNKSAKIANMSLGAQYKTKNKRADPSKLAVAKGKSGRAAFGEVKGATMLDALRGTGQVRQVGDKARKEAGEADNGVIMILNSLKRQIKKRGGTGMIGLSRKFRIMDDSGDGELQFCEFKKAMREMDFDLNDKDLHKMFDHFDADGGGTVSYEEFIQGVRDPLSERRLALIKQAFAIIDKDGSGVIEAHEVAGAFDASKHPEVISGKKTAQQVLEDFLKTFDVGGVVDGAVTLQEFTNYYHNISASIHNEDYFELMIRNAWHISGGEGAAANSANKRVLITDSSGKQRVVEIQNDLGLDLVPEKQRNEEIMKRLKKQGVDVMGIDTKGAVEEKDVAKEGPNAPNPVPMGALKVKASMGKGSGALATKATSQIQLSGGSAADNANYNKAMGLSYARNDKGNAAWASTMGPGLEEMGDDNGEIGDYKPSGVQGAVPGTPGSSLAVLAKKDDVEKVIEKVRGKLIERGARGLTSLARKFRIFDEDNSKSLDPQEFAKAMKESNVLLSKKELIDLFSFFDADGSGTITYQEFLDGVRGPVNDKRIALMEAAFKIIDADGNGTLEPAEVVGAFDGSRHPDVLTGKQTEGEVRSEFLDTFDVGGEKEGKVTKNEFMNYYKNVSVAIEADDYFELMMRNVWGISGGTAWEEQSEHTRVLVTHKDGKEEIVEVVNDVGLKYGDKTECKRRLREQGLNPASVRFMDTAVIDSRPKENLNWKTTLSLS